MATHIYTSPQGKSLVELSDGTKILLPFQTSDATLQANIAASQSYTNGDIVINDSYAVNFPDTYIFTETDL